MSNKLSIAVIGCGRVSGHHIRAIHNNPNLSLAAIADIDSKRMAEVLGAETVPSYTNYHDMLENHPEINAVAIITPSGMHFEHALDMVRLYKKHVIIEKPIVMTPQQGEQLAKAALDQGVQVFPVHQYRFNRCVQRIKRAINENELGNVFLATVRMRWCRPQSYYDRAPWRGTYALDGGCCTNQGIHHLDLLRYLNGEIKRVNVLMQTTGSNIEVEDTVVALLEFENGAIGNLEITTAARPDDIESSLSIMGSKGLAMLGGAFTDKLLEFSPDESQKTVCSDDFKDAYGLGHNDIYEGVYGSINGLGKPALTFDDGMKTIQLLHAIYASAEQKCWINVDDNVTSQKLGIVDDQLADLYRVHKKPA